MKPHLLALRTSDLRSLLSDLGQPAFRAKQLADWVFDKRVDSFDRMPNIPKALRNALEERVALRTLAAVEHHASRDGLTEKWLFRTRDGHGLETVLIRDRNSDRRTACVSTSLGCTLGCRFCASATGPFIRHLEAGEIIEEVVRIEDLLRQRDRGAESERITNVVFMGTGEPFLNYDAVLAAARRMNAADGLGIGARHITVSTAGVVPGIERFSAEPEDFRLAVSLHAASQPVREKLIPSARKWRLDRILEALRRYTRERRREVTIEYVLIDGVNAESRDAMRLVELLADIPCKVNCIPFNPAAKDAWSPPPMKACRAFVGTLENRGVRATLRTEKGQEIDAACGQLRARKLEEEGNA